MSSQHADDGFFLRLGAVVEVAPTPFRELLGESVCVLSGFYQLRGKHLDRTHAAPSLSMPERTNHPRMYDTYGFRCTFEWHG